VDWWRDRLDASIELCPLLTDNFSSTEQYNDFMKSPRLWKDLTGEFVLTLQADCWILNQPPYTIDYFVKLNKSFVGGNMNYYWQELQREGIHLPIKNFNGGLSLRKRLDLIRITNAFPPKMTLKPEHSMDFTQDAEDVYFTIGCLKLGLPVGDDEPSSHFAIHCIFHDEAFGIHNPCRPETIATINLRYPELKRLNPSLKLSP